MGVNHNGWIDGSTTTSASCCHFNLKTLNTLTSLQQGGISSHFFFFKFSNSGSQEHLSQSHWERCAVHPGHVASLSQA